MENGLYTALKSQKLSRICSVTPALVILTILMNGCREENDHKDGIEISGYCKRYGFLSKNGIHAKYWRDIPQPPKGE